MNSSSPGASAQSIMHVQHEAASTTVAERAGILRDGPSNGIGRMETVLGAFRHTPSLIRSAGVF